MPPSMKLYLRRQQTDAADDEAICQAVRPTRCLVPVKRERERLDLAVTGIL